MAEDLETTVCNAWSAVRICGPRSAVRTLGPRSESVVPGPRSEPLVGGPNLWSPVRGPRSEPLARGPNLWSPVRSPNPWLAVQICGPRAAARGRSEPLRMGQHGNQFFKVAPSLREIDKANLSRNPDSIMLMP